MIDGCPAGSLNGASASERPGPPPWSGAQATIVDLWAGSTIARRVASLQFYSGVSRLMAPAGVFVANLIDGPGFAWSRRQAATIATLFAHVAIVMDGRMLADPLIGNVLVFGADVPLDMLSEPGWPAGDRNPPAVLSGERATRWIGDASPVDDTEATDSPPPRADYFARFSKGPGGLVGTLGDAVRRQH
ncbi:hypothetical protein B7R25_04450 [Subtercola boreus]|uniref:Spermine synthase n=1 Tax=Subtercola boreus TaxID=120213 RepID=A0A3E0WFK2_9MICO|nr:hypothetical protein B7R24_04440 [Subtercola boreus]RFA22459.1 hypothetical protein B7R23_04435 [Subtercola boreus]RFA28474.1 hypothetical protein B7R25_04450 [Subtercola boreus]